MNWKFKFQSIHPHFIVNEKKTRFLSPKVHKEVIGVTVNDGVIKVPKEMKRMVRAMIHYEIVTGDYFIMKKLEDMSHILIPWRKITEIKL